MEQGTSRGGADIGEIVKRLSLWGVNMLYVGEPTPQAFKQLHLLDVPDDM